MQSKLAINPFSFRQFNIDDNSDFGGFTGTPEELLKILMEQYREEDFKQGFAPFVRTLDIYPGHLHLFLGTFRCVLEGENMISRCESRRTGELPVLTNYLVGTGLFGKPHASEGRLIFYSHEQLEKEGEETTLGSEWELISINIGPAEEPMLPATLWRNYWYSRDPKDPRGKGGSPHFEGKSDAEFLAMLWESEQYWSIRGKVVPKIPE